MKARISTHVVHFFALASFTAGLAQLFAQAESPADGDFHVTQRTPHTRTWQKEIVEPTPLGDKTRTIIVTELASGICYQKDDGTLADSSDQLELLPDGSAAIGTRGQTKVSFPADLATGVIVVTGPDGTRLTSRPLCLAFDDGTDSVLLAQLTNSTGQLLPEGNGVIWTNAFSENGIQGDIIAKYKLSGVEVDLAIRSWPQGLDPEFAGLNNESCQLQLYTELFGTDDPVLETVSGSQTSELPWYYSGTAAGQSGRLRFGSMRMAVGTAFPVGPGGKSGATATVRQLWRHSDDRKVLIEQVPLSNITGGLRDLHAANSPAKTSNLLAASLPRHASATFLLPARPTALTSGAKPIQLARADTLPAHGYIIDYDLYGSVSSFVLKGTDTYVVTAPFYVGPGTLTIQPSVVVKYKNSVGAKISFSGPLVSETTAYGPAVFSSVNDNSLWPTASGSNGSPSTSPDAIYLEGTSTADKEFRWMRFCYAYIGVSTATNTYTDFRHCQFFRCNTAIRAYGNCARLYNTLIARCGTGLSNCGYFTAQQATFDQIGTLAASLRLSGSSALNAILTAVTNVDASISLQNYLQQSSGLGVYRQAGGGAYYLDSAQPRHTGTTNLDSALLSDLRTLTVDAPTVFSNVTFNASLALGPIAERDTGIPSLGAHYPALDYAFGGVHCYSNISFAAGTAVGWFHTSSGWQHAGHGIHLGDRQTATFSGTAEAPCRWTRCNTVQEGGTGQWDGGYGPGGITGWAWPDTNNAPTISLRFTKCSSLSQEMSHFRDDYGYLVIRARDCEFGPPAIGGYLFSLGATNCFFRNCVLDLEGGRAGTEFTLRNCTQVGSSLILHRNAYNPNDPGYGQVPATITDCAFDGVSVSTADGRYTDPTLTYFDYNAFLTNQSRTTPTGPNDVIVTNFNWEPSWFGNYYSPTNSQLVDAGSLASAANIGLYHFTTATNQTIEGTSRLDIGYHFVATDSTGRPLDFDGDTVPNYLEDLDGDGDDTDDPTSWRNYDCQNGLPSGSGILVFTPLK